MNIQVIDAENTYISLAGVLWVICILCFTCSKFYPRLCFVMRPVHFNTLSGSYQCSSYSLKWGKKKKIINNGQNSAAHVCGVHGAPVYSCVLIKNCWRAGADEVSHSPCCSKTKYAASGVQCAAWQGIVAYGRWKIAYCFVSAPWVRWSTWAKAERTWKQLAAGCIYGLSQSRTHAFPHVTPGLWEHE